MARNSFILLICWVLFAAQAHIGEAFQSQLHLASLGVRSSSRSVPRTYPINSRSYTALDTGLRQHNGQSTRRSKRNTIPPFEGRLLPLQKKIKTITFELVPPIPALQNKGIRFEDRLNVRFIVGEMLYGAWYQCRLLPLHIFGAMTTNAIQAIFALSNTGSAIAPLVTPSKAEVTFLACPVDFISQKIQNAIAGPISAASKGALSMLAIPLDPTLFQQRIVTPILVAPISEEIAFRGICQKLAQTIFFIRLHVRAMIARHLGIRFVIASEVAAYLSCILNTWAGIANKRPSIGGVWFEHLFPIVEISLLLPPLVSIIDFLRRKVSSKNWKSERVRPCSLNEAYDWNEEDMYGQPSSRLRIARTVDKYRRSKDGRHFLYYNYQRVADYSAKRYSRWVGASLFASAHALGGTYCHNKLLGTLASSLLVESRLYANRGIVASIGAHMMYNFLVFLVPMGSLPNKALYENPKIWPLTIVAYPFYCMATLIIGNGVRWTEGRVRGYNVDTESVYVERETGTASATRAILLVASLLCVQITNQIV